MKTGYEKIIAAFPSKAFQLLQEMQELLANTITPGGSDDAIYPLWSRSVEFNETIKNYVEAKERHLEVLELRKAMKRSAK
jgi:hypothetical protein